MDNLKNVLITGGSGLIGKRLTALLMQKGYSVSHLGRSEGKISGVRSFKWDVAHQTIESEALENVQTIIHLAGAGVNDQRWSDKRKKEILHSRTDSTQLLKHTLEKMDHQVKTFISASGIGYYGFAGGEKSFVEEDLAGTDFLAKVTAAWENESAKLKDIGLRVVRIRTGVVLSNQGGALKELAKPIKLGVGAPLGTGEQILSWIHIDDLCNIFIKALEDKSMDGIYNGVAPHPVTNKAMTQAIAKTLNKPLLLPPIPGLIIKMVVGEVAEIVLNGSVISSKKIQKAGFHFQFQTVQEALKDLLQ